MYASTRCEPKTSSAALASAMWPSARISGNVIAMNDAPFSQPAKAFTSFVLSSKRNGIPSTFSFRPGGSDATNARMISFDSACMKPIVKNPPPSTAPGGSAAGCDCGAPGTGAGCAVVGAPGIGDVAPHGKFGGRKTGTGSPGIQGGAEADCASAAGVRAVANVKARSARESRMMEEA